MFYWVLKFKSFFLVFKWTDRGRYWREACKAENEYCNGTYNSNITSRFGKLFCRHKFLCYTLEGVHLNWPKSSWFLLFRVTNTVVRSETTSRPFLEEIITSLLLFILRFWVGPSLGIKLIHFWPMCPISLPLKSPENQRFSGGMNGNIGAKWVNISQTLSD